MAFDLLIKNGRVIDGSGGPAYLGDIGVRNGKIAEIGRLRGTAPRTINADGLVVAPGFIDTHCHYDAQVTWDPLCEFSCYHGVTSVIIGNCSLALAPVRPGSGERLAEFLSYVEAIPMETLKTVDMNWETIGEYMAVLDQRLGVNVGNLIGHSAVRCYVMGNDCQGRAPTAAEIEAMCDAVRDGMSAGALGFSIDRSRGHYDSRGIRIPSTWADEDEIFALGRVLGEFGAGIIQVGDGNKAEMNNRMMSRLAEATGRQVIYSSLAQTSKQPGAWKEHMALVDATVKAGIRANPAVSSKVTTRHFDMHNSQFFGGVPTWQPILTASDDEKLRLYRDPEIRKKLHREVIDWAVEMPNVQNAFGRNWYDKILVDKVVLTKNKPFEGKSVRQLAEAQGKGIIDALLDLTVEENLDTVFLRLGNAETDSEAMSAILNYPHAYISLSDAGAHVQFQGGYGYCSNLLGHWVRRKGIMPLEQAVKRLTFDSASVFGIYDRGLLRPGLAADIVIFDADTIDSLPVDVVHDYPGGAWRMRELASGVHYTIVNGQVLIEDGHHTGALPGRVLRNSVYQQSARA